MAPRKRQKLMRIDAALDAMRPLGFPDTLVRTTVRHLLKVYDGNESWPFIEDSAYKVLIETLLDLPNEEEEEKEEEQAQGNCDGEECQCDKHKVGHNDLAEELVPNGDIGDERERVDDQQLQLYDHDVVDEDVCQNCDGEECQCDKHKVGHDDLAEELVPNGDIGDERERVDDQQLELYDHDVVDEDVCQEDGVDNENHHSSPEDGNLSTALEGHVHFASSCTPQVNCATAIQTRAPCFGWIVEDD